MDATRRNLGSAGASHFGINFRIFLFFSPLADLSLEFSRPAVLLYYPHSTYLSRLSVAELLLPASTNRARWWRRVTAATSIATAGATQQSRVPDGRDRKCPRTSDSARCSAWPRLKSREKPCQLVLCRSFVHERDRTTAKPSCEPLLPHQPHKRV